MRVGIGYDVHALVSDRPLILGGVAVPYTAGLSGHSDADVLTHAIIDALLGAVGDGDIGSHFPDTDPRYKDVSSLVLLGVVIERLTGLGYQIENIDSVVVAEKPVLRPFILTMRQTLSMAMNVPVSAVSIKATTSERLGFEGRKEGISAQAIALIQRM